MGDPAPLDPEYDIGTASSEKAVRGRGVAEIIGRSVHGDWVALEGEVLTDGHPVRDAYLSQPDPVVNGSQNPVGYCALPEEQPFVQRPCACGCDELSDRDFLPGHDVRAMQARVREHFHGSALNFTFGVACRGCPLRQRCTTSKTGRSLSLHPTTRCYGKPAGTGARTRTYARPPEPPYGRTLDRLADRAEGTAAANCATAA